MSNLKTKENTLKVFLSKIDSEYVITDREFAYKDFCEARDEYGQRFGCARAGCYSLVNPYVEQDFCKDKKEQLLKLLHKKFKLQGEEICNSIEEYKATNQDLYYEVLKKEFNKGWGEEHTQKRYETVWNGHNCVSIFVDDNDTDFVADLEEISNEEEEEILQDFENAELIKDDRITKIYKGKKYEFVKSYAQDAWETYSVRKLTDEE